MVLDIISPPGCRCPRRLEVKGERRKGGVRHIHISQLPFLSVFFFSFFQMKVETKVTVKLYSDSESKKSKSKKNPK